MVEWSRFVRMLRSVRGWLAGALVSSALSATASPFTPFDQGSIGYAFSPFTKYSHDANATDVYVGEFFMTMGLRTHAVTAAYAWFDVPASAVVHSATLRLSADFDSFDSALFRAWSIELPHSNYDYSYTTRWPFTPVPLEAQTLYDDVVSGNLYLSAQIASFFPTSYAFTLSPSAIDALNTARGGQFGIGFTAHQVYTPVSVVLSGLQLELEASAVPTPPIALSMLAGLAALVCLRPRAVAR